MRPLQAGEAGLVLGLYGKLPAHGDFVRRGLPVSFCAPWDTWLQRGLAAASKHFGEADLPQVWQAAPAWRFALPAGACGPAAVAGVMLPAADSVGRRFPLTVACVRGASGPGPAPWPANWFGALEGAARAGLDDGLDADTLMSMLPWPQPEGGLAVARLGWWSADTEAAPGLIWSFPALPTPAEFPMFLEFAA